jgi:hypothetical protein
MWYVVAFILGFMVGGFLGVMAMGLLTWSK